MEQGKRIDDWKFVESELKKRGSNLNHAVNVMITVLAEAFAEDEAGSTNVMIPAQIIDL